MKAKKGIQTHGHMISGAFVFLLLGVFVVFSTFMVLLSAQFYRTTVEDTSTHNTQRVLGSYLMNVVRGNDVADSVDVECVGDTDVLCFEYDMDGDDFVTRIYYWDGYIREQFGEADQEFDQNHGDKICAAKAFVPELDGDGLLKLYIVDETGAERTLHAALRCAAQQEVTRQ